MTALQRQKGLLMIQMFFSDLGDKNCLSMEDQLKVQKKIEENKKQMAKAEARKKRQEKEQLKLEKEEKRLKNLEEGIEEEE